MTWGRGLAATLPLLVLPACDDSGLVATPGPLVEASQWAAWEGEDPMPEHRPARVSCPPAGWSVEGTSLEVDTGKCNYLTVEQPLLLDLPAGTPVTVNLWHQALHADDPGTGHAALFVGDELVWEQQVIIPGPGSLWVGEVVPAADHPAGEPVIFHLHNHGANTWNLGDVQAM